MQPYRVTFVVDSFGRSGALYQALSRRAAAHLLFALTRLDRAWLAQQAPHAPRSKDFTGTLDDSQEGDQHEWQDVAGILASGTCCLEDYLAWQAAEGQRVDWTRALARRRPRRITFALSCFARADRFGAKDAAHAAVGACLSALAAIDRDWLRAHPGAPLLYQSGVTYEEEPPGQDDWLDVATALAEGVADCEDLACWRAAELAVRSGVAAAPTYLWRRRPRGGLLYHIQVAWPDTSGKISRASPVEDPSRRLGML
jgi:hypothetical protein